MVQKEPLTLYQYKVIYQKAMFVPTRRAFLGKGENNKVGIQWTLFFFDNLCKECLIWLKLAVELGKI